MARIVRVHQPITLRQVVDELMAKTNLSQTGLATKMKVNRVTISQIRRRGAVGPSIAGKLLNFAEKVPGFNLRKLKRALAQMPQQKYFKGPKLTLSTSPTKLEKAIEKLIRKTGWALGDLAGKVGVSISGLSRQVHGGRGLNPKVGKKLIKIAEKVTDFDVKQLQRAIANLPSLQGRKFPHGPMKLDYRPKTKFGRDFGQLFRMKGLTQQGFAGVAHVSVAFVQSALHDKVKKPKRRQAVNLVNVARTVSLTQVSKMEKYLPFYRQKVSNRVLREHHIHPFVKIMNPLMDAAEGKGINAVAVARFLRVTPVSVGRLVTGANGPGRKIYPRLLSFAKKLPGYDDTKLRNYQPTRHGSVHAREGRGK